jgi:hypothetical protein
MMKIHWTLAADARRLQLKHAPRAMYYGPRREDQEAAQE